MKIMPSILVVEDDKLQRQRIVSVLMGMDIDFIIHAEENGAEALKLCTKKYIDYFIIDLELPGMTGMDLIHEIRKKYLHNPIIISSQYAYDAFKKRLHNKIPPLSYLEKPFNDNELINAVHFNFLCRGNTGERDLLLKTKEFTRRVTIDEILYIEKLPGIKAIRLVTYTPDEGIFMETIRNFSLKEITTVIKDERLLLRCHKSFMVNPDKIKKMDWSNQSLILTIENSTVPLGRTYADNILKVMERISQ